MGEQAIDRAFEIAPVGDDRARDEGDEPPARRRNSGSWPRAAAMRASRIFIRSGSSSAAHLDAKAAGQPRAHALVERLEIAGRPVGGDDDLAARVEQRVERVAELVLNRLALQKLRVVEDQEIDRRAAPP